MKVRALDSNGDWTLGKGLNDYVQNRDAVKQNIRTRLFSFLGDCFFDAGAGIDWFNLLGGKDLASLQLSIRATILNTEGVSGIVSASAVINAQRNLQINYSYTDIYSQVSQGNTVSNNADGYILTQDGNILSTQDGGGIQF
jgi:hypothetical protein